MTVSQGAAIRQVLAALRSSGWTVAFYSMPNAAHIGVVPIPVAGAHRMQRYPDIVAFDAEQLLLVEVEPTLTPPVEAEIRQRFTDHDSALEKPTVWRAWKEHVEASSGLLLPTYFRPLHQLVVCRSILRRAEPDVEIVSVQDYAAPPAFRATIDRTS